MSVEVDGKVKAEAVGVALGSSAAPAAAVVYTLAGGTGIVGIVPYATIAMAGGALGMGLGGLCYGAYRSVAWLTSSSQSYVVQQTNIAAQQNIQMNQLNQTLRDQTRSMKANVKKLDEATNHHVEATTKIIAKAREAINVVDAATDKLESTQETIYRAASEIEEKTDRVDAFSEQLSEFNEKLEINVITKDQKMVNQSKKIKKLERRLKQGEDASRFIIKSRNAEIDQLKARLTQYENQKNENNS